MNGALKARAEQNVIARQPAVHVAV